MLVLMITLCSCGTAEKTQSGISSQDVASKSNDVTFYPEYIKYNMYRSGGSTNEFSFNINAISDTKNLNIEYFSAEGENTEYISDVSFTDETFDSLKHKKIGGKYFHILGIKIKTITDDVTVDPLTVKVNGKEQTFNFETPIENKFFDYSDDDRALFIQGVPVYIFTNSFVGRNETLYDFSVSAQEDVTVTEIKFEDFLTFANDTVSVNGLEKGTIKDALPMKLKKGDVINVKSCFKPKDDEKMYMSNIYTNVVVEYDFGSKKFKERCPLSAIYVGNEGEAQSFADANMK